VFLWPGVLVMVSILVHFNRSCHKLSLVINVVIGNRTFFLVHICSEESTSTIHVDGRFRMILMHEIL
jgi:hypothetical protein